MKDLQPDWFMQPVIDFETKSYQLLSWLQHAKQSRDSIRLYPWKVALQVHQKSLCSFYSNLLDLENRFPKLVRSLSWDPPGIQYETITIPETEEWNTIRQIVEWAIPIVNKEATQYLRLHEDLWEEIQIEPVGIEPGYTREGHLLLPHHKKIHVFRYCLSRVFQDQDTPLPISTRYEYSVNQTLGTTYSGIKSELQKRCNYPTAVYAVQSALHLPIKETLLPVASERLRRYLSAIDK